VLIEDMRETVPLAELLVLPFDGTSLWVAVYFLWAIDTREKGFCGRFLFGWEGDPEYGLNSQ